MNGFWAILIKEFAHIRRERSTLVFAFVVPVIQLFLFGFAINTRIEHIRTGVLDLDGRREARELVEALSNTRSFRVVERCTDRDALQQALVGGRIKVGLIIPADFSNRLLNREQALVQVLIDGSDSQAAVTALNTSSLLGFRQSLARARPFVDAMQAAVARDRFGEWAMPIEVRPRLLFNPDLKSTYFFIPALVGIILQNVTIFLTAFTVVREREHGTLEQLFVTPVGRLGLLLGKLLPYALLGFLVTLVVLAVMVFVFGVPISGDIGLLLALSMLFLLAALGLGLLISTLASTQLQAIQLVFVVLLPSILLSGFIFPREEMPLPIYWLSFCIPVTYFLEILRGLILRGAGLIDLAEHVALLAVCSLVILALSVARFRKQVT